MKRPGPQMLPMPVELSAVEKNKTQQETPYERLLTDAMQGDKLLFRSRGCSRGCVVDCRSDS